MRSKLLAYFSLFFLSYISLSLFLSFFLSFIHSFIFFLQLGSDGVWWDLHIAEWCPSVRAAERVHQHSKGLHASRDTPCQAPQHNHLALHRQESLDSAQTKLQAGGSHARIQCPCHRKRGTCLLSYLPFIFIMSTLCPYIPLHQCFVSPSPSSLRCSYSANNNDTSYSKPPIPFAVTKLYFTALYCTHFTALHRTLLLLSL